MDRLDPRIVRVGIEVDGQFKVYEDLDISVRGSKTSNALQNTCEVTITNLASATRNYILTETSPFNDNKTPKRMFVEVGRVSTGVTRIFTGEITQATPSQPPDIGLTLKAKTGAFANGQVVARSEPAQQSLRAIAGRVAADIGVSLDFQAADKQVANYAYTGSALRQVNALELVGGVDAFVDDETLVVKDRTAALPGRSRILSQDSGLIGIPEVTERGVRATMLLDSQTTVGGALDIKSALNPSLDGTYTIYKLDFAAESRGQAFYWIAEASRNGYVPPAAT